MPDPLPTPEAGIRAVESPISAYIHVPFCAHRCGYCDFTLVARRDDLIEPYLTALAQDLESLGEPRPVETLFFGGGTPTRLTPAQLDTLTKLTARWFLLGAGGEFSVEANPAALDEQRLAVLSNAGVNRISLGIQSFDDRTLTFLERDHRSAELPAVVNRIRTRFSNFGIDLIFGVPGQTLESWRETLQRATDLGPTHISTYGLTFEKGTTFWSRRNRSEFAAAPEELERDMYAAAMDDLSAAGFVHYELSNFAQPGFECRHNQMYWRRGEYYGHGPGAVRLLKGRREMNHRSVSTWIHRLQTGISPIAEIEELEPAAAAREGAILGLRRTSGIDRRQFLMQFGIELDLLCGDAIQQHLRQGLLEDFGTGVRLTREGRFLADSVMVDFA